MGAIANSGPGRWMGHLLLEYCPRKDPSCYLRCLASAFCEAARPRVKTQWWHVMAGEQRREVAIYALLGIASFILVLRAFLAPFWR